MSKLMELADAYAHATWGESDEKHEARAALVAEVEKLERDAARYRWLREASDETPSKTPVATLQNGAGWQVRYEYYGDRFKPFVVYQKETLDAAIDAAMEATNEQERYVRMCPDIECGRKKKCTRMVGVSCMSRADIGAHGIGADK